MYINIIQQEKWSRLKKKKRRFTSRPCCCCFFEPAKWENKFLTVKALPSGNNVHFVTSASRAELLNHFRMRTESRALCKLLGFRTADGAETHRDKASVWTVVKVKRHISGKFEGLFFGGGCCLWFKFITVMLVSKTLTIFFYIFVCFLPPYFPLKSLDKRKCPSARSWSSIWSVSVCACVRERDFSVLLNII